MISAFRLHQVIILDQPTAFAYDSENRLLDEMKYRASDMDRVFKDIGENRPERAEG